MVIADAMAVGVAYLLAVTLRNHLGPLFADLAFASLAPYNDIKAAQYIYFLVGAAPLWCLALYLNGLYRSLRTVSEGRLFWQITKAAGMAFLGLGALMFMFKVTSASRFLFFLFLIISYIIISAERISFFLVMHAARRRGLGHSHLLVVGTGPRAAAFITRIMKHPEWGLKVTGVIDDEPGRGVKQVASLPITGFLSDIPDILHREAIDEVAFIVPRSRLSAVEAALHACETEGVVTTFAVDLFDMKIARAEVSLFDTLPLLQFQTIKISEWQLFAKRAIDLTVSAAILIALAPFFLVLGLIIKVSSKGPVFFRQERVGLHGRHFILYKFRTMRLGAHDILSQVNDVAEMDTPEFRASKIKWMTPIGRFMRKFSVDELPQLMNVFKGDMSLIGPRPTVPDEVDKYKPWQRRRFSMKPGITCLWQVSGRNKIGFEDWMKLDLKYVDNWSLGLDIMIMLRTIPVVIFGIGAY